jgi:hypothetical protein
MDRALIGISGRQLRRYFEISLLDMYLAWDDS